MKITFSLVVYILVMIYFAAIGAHAARDSFGILLRGGAFVIVGYFAYENIRDNRQPRKIERRLEIGGPLDNPHDIN